MRPDRVSSRCSRLSIQPKQSASSTASTTETPPGLERWLLPKNEPRARLAIVVFREPGAPHPPITRPQLGEVRYSAATSTTSRFGEVKVKTRRYGVPWIPSAHCW